MQVKALCCQQRTCTPQYRFDLNWVFTNPLKINTFYSHIRIWQFQAFIKFHNVMPCCTLFETFPLSPFVGFDLFIKRRIYHINSTKKLKSCLHNMAIVRICSFHIMNNCTSGQHSLKNQFITLYQYLLSSFIASGFTQITVFKVTCVLCFLESIKEHLPVTNDEW